MTFSDEVGGGFGDLYDVLRRPAWHAQAVCRDRPDIT
jgi:hypothetical protein